MIQSLPPVNSAALFAMTSPGNVTHRPEGTQKPSAETTTRPVNAPERPVREPASSGNRQGDREESAGEEELFDSRGFIDTILSGGLFQPVTERGGQGERDAPGQDYFFARGSPDAVQATQDSGLSRVRAAADAWQRLEPQRLDTSNLPPAVATYMTVQTGGTPALGLSLYA